MTEHQPSLFSAAELGGCYAVTPPSGLQMSADALAAWKQRVFQYQQSVRSNQPLQQGCLFEPLHSPAPDNPVDSLDPFGLSRQNIEFWRWKVEDGGVSALYFVIDDALPILLYVGETMQSNQRWKGEHGCKQYLLNYQQAHYQLQVETRLGIRFWTEAPRQTRPRQKLELALIRKWKAPFNKENWQLWGTPFVGNK